MSNHLSEYQPFPNRAHAETPVRSLQLFRAASLLCGIFENEIATVAHWREPTPLPQAPHTVLGVVCIQGRMLTVLSLATLLDNSVSTEQSHHILALRGDEQLALAVEAVTETIEIDDDLLAKAANSGEGLVLGVVDHDGAEITILNVKGLFPSAIQGRERRRRRF
jgi:purine-binding chemotaxis protein CheW